MRLPAIAFLILSLASANAQIPWDIEIIKGDAIGNEPGFSNSFSPINSPNYFELGWVYVEQPDGKRNRATKMLDYKTMTVTNLVVPMDKFPASHRSEERRVGKE